MRILLYEHLTGGGFVGTALPSSLLCEGYAMLRGLVSDFKRAGYNVTILLDSRVAATDQLLDADQVVQVTSLREVSLKFDAAVANVDAVYVVAPESNNLLQSAVKRTEAAGALSLNSSPEAVGLAADKALLHSRAMHMGMNLPRTVICRVTDSIDHTLAAIKNKLGFPAIIKPAKGTSCQGLSMIRTEEQVLAAVEKIKTHALGDDLIVQELIRGTPVSVSLICTCGEALPISLNLQDVTLAAPNGESCYNGGSVPFEHQLRDEAFSVAKRLVEYFGDLEGYVGVDLVLSKAGIFVLEVNPRLTTSYVGLRSVVNFNVAEAIAGSVTAGRRTAGFQIANHNPVVFRGVSCFSKMHLLVDEVDNFVGIRGMPEVVSPPFPEIEDGACALVQSYGDTAEEAKNRLDHLKKRLCHRQLGAWQ